MGYTPLKPQSLDERSERVLITGGNGFIGSHLAKFLLLEGHFVRVVDLDSNSYMKGEYCSEELRLDLRSWKNCLAVTKGMDEVYNLAANMGGIGFITEVGAEVMHDNSLINTYMLEASNPGEITLWGDGRQTRSFCHIDDCVRGTVMLMESACDKPMNIGSERLVTINELADMVIKISGKKISKTYDLDAPQGVRGRNADISLAQRVLGWEPEVSLEEGLDRTYRWIRAQIMG